MRPATDIRRAPAKPLDLRSKPAVPPSSATAGRFQSLAPKTVRLAPARPAGITTRKIRSALKSWLAYPLIVLLATVIGLASSSLAVGQWLVAIYAIFAIWRLPSQLSFGLGLLTLVLVPAFTLLKREVLAENYAVYAYYFLVIGVVQAILELRRSRHDH